MFLNLIANYQKLGLMTPEQVAFSPQSGYAGKASSQKENPMNILIVDDDPGLLNHLKTALDKKHYGVDTAKDGEAALDRIFDLS